MSSRVLTPDVVGIDALVHDHQTVLAKAEGGVVAVFANNAPAFYAVTPARLAELLALEEKLARPGSDVALDDQLYQEPQAAPVAVNAVADMFKGHINTGLARWAIASLLTLATCVGVVMALTIWGLRGWV